VCGGETPGKRTGEKRSGNAIDKERLWWGLASRKQAKLEGSEVGQQKPGLKLRG